MTRAGAEARAASTATAVPPTRTAPPASPRGGGLWPFARRWLLPAFMLFVLAMLATHLRDVDWTGAWKALRAYHPALLWTAGAFAAASFLLYGCFDLLGRAYTAHRLPIARTWATAFISYAFNLNLGSIVGALGMRWRLYARAGLDDATIGRVVAFSMLTNWLGYAALAGALFASGVLDMPADFALGDGALRLIGMAMLGAVAVYLGACAFSKRREFALRTHRLELPSWRMALLQLAVSTSNWALMGAIVFTLMGHAVPYPTVLGVLLTAAIAGLATHVPANLGVMEAVFLAFLSGTMPQGTLLGAVLAYRAIYYLAPMAVALVAYGVLEGLGPRRP